MMLSNAISKRITMICQERQISEKHLLERLPGDAKAVLAVMRGQDQIVLLDLMDKICWALGISRVDFFRSSLFESF